MRRSTQVQMNISASVVGRAVLCTPWDINSDGAHGVMRPTLDFAALRLGVTNRTTTAPDPPGTGTKGKSSRARNISRRLQRSALEPLYGCYAQSGPANLFRCPPQSVLHRAVRSALDQPCFVAKSLDGFDQAARRIDPAAAD